jgi:hypothetical protein
MQINTHQQPKMAQPRPYTQFPARKPRTEAQSNRPAEHPGLSQAELRRIVIDLIG